MNFSQKGCIKILLTLQIFLLATVFCNVAEASTLTNSFSSIYSYINANIVGKVKSDFCHNYILAISNGEWKAGEFRTNLGKKVCTSYTISVNAGKIVPTKTQTLNGNTAINSEVNIGTTSINNPLPDVYTPSLTANSSDLNSSQIIDLTNKERKNNDPMLVNLLENNILENIAAIRVKDMFARQYFEHISPTGDNVSKEAVNNGYKYITIGENIALGSFDGSEGVVKAWMDSEGHKENILNKNYTEIGVYAEKNNYNGQKVWIAAQVFAKPMTCKSADASIKVKVENYKNSADSLMTNIKNIDDELKTISASDIQTYNAKVSERNTLAGLYNNLASEIKTLVAEYNSAVSAYNMCIKTL